MDNTSHSSHSRGFAALLPHGTSHDHATAKPCCDTGGHRLPSGHAMPRIVFIGNPNVGKSSLFNALLGASHDHATAKPCCDTGGHRLPSGHAMPRIVFIGNPNVGKSSLFNALLGAKARVMNVPGTTVLLEEGVYTHNGVQWDLIDTPGTYSLLPLSPDERVAAEAVMGLNGEATPDLIVAVLDATNISRALYTPGTYSLLPLSPDERVAAEAVMGLNGEATPDLIVAVLDATNISRALYFLSMVLELGRPTVVALTMNDLAAKQGTGIDAALLSRALGGVPVVPVNGRTGEGAGELMDTVSAHLHGTPLPEGLETIDPRHVDVQRWVEDGADERFDWAARVLDGLGTNARDRVTFSDRIDGVLLHPVLGILIFLAIMLGMFEATTTLAGPAQDWVDGPVRDWLTALIDVVFSWFGPQATQSWFHSLVIDGVVDGVITIGTFIPPMGIMFILLSLLEDSGYLARAAFVMDRAMRCMGLDGRAFLPIVIGFGCNLPALAATRTLPDSRQRVLVGMLVPFSSCTARLSVYLVLPIVIGFGCNLPALAATRTLPDSRQRVLVGMLVPFSSCTARLSVYLVLAYAFFREQAGLVVFLMYVCSIVLILLLGMLLRAVQFRDLRSEPFAMSLPPYQMPRLIVLARSVLLRLWGFVRGASSIIISMLVVRPTRCRASSCSRAACCCACGDSCAVRVRSSSRCSW